MDLAVWQQPAVIQHTQRLLHSFYHWTGQSLLSHQGDPEAEAQALFTASFVVVSHGTQADPILNYGNQVALDLWQMDWHRFTATPSRCTAEPMEREERAKLLAQAKAQGFINNYQGIRISSTGQRFYIQDVVIWDVLDEAHQPCGQAATFNQWQFINAEKP
ncbi:MAG: MEKHLA domain-containing protein [Leptolyngbyaceae bacterium]|nr:MEKHLA domain-containing protein [Leptolyngbyaceae bacterium]